LFTTASTAQESSAAFPVFYYESSQAPLRLPHKATPIPALSALPQDAAHAAEYVI